MAAKMVKGGLGLFGVLVVGLGGGFLWGSSVTATKLATSHETHRIDLALPWPLSEAEIDALRAERTVPGDEAPVGAGADAVPGDPLAGVDLTAIATERALVRGKHLIESRYACIECHGANLGGGTMIDDPALGSLLGSNITTGKGSRTLSYTAADWDRAVRHGVKPDGTPMMMPCEDFYGMSDQELSDIVTYIRAQPAVDAEVPASTLGPVGTLLAATGKLTLWAEHHPDHARAHEALPPPTAVTVEFGAHMAQVCSGCHRADFAGGPMANGDPSWPAARNLTPHADGMKGWTLEQFTVALREAKRPDGTALKDPMPLIAPYARNMTETELQALFTFLQSLPERPTGT